jgi:hypothetical protein
MKHGLYAVLQIIQSLQADHCFRIDRPIPTIFADIGVERIPVKYLKPLLRQETFQNAPCASSAKGTRFLKGHKSILAPSY